jgi:deoxyadenosine/deoxycytidine kinase
MQIWLLKQRFITYCQSLKFAYDNDDCNGVVLDRSIFADSVFAEKNFIDNNYSREGYDCYLELRKRLLAKLPLPDAIVYLNASAKTCADRVNSRARNCESGAFFFYFNLFCFPFPLFLQNVEVYFFHWYPIFYLPSTNANESDEC